MGSEKAASLWVPCNRRAWQGEESGREGGSESAPCKKKTPGMGGRSWPKGDQGTKGAGERSPAKGARPTGWRADTGGTLSSTTFYQGWVPSTGQRAWAWQAQPHLRAESEAAPRDSGAAGGSEATAMFSPRRGGVSGPHSLLRSLESPTAPEAQVQVFASPKGVGTEAQRSQGCPGTRRGPLQWLLPMPRREPSRAPAAIWGSAGENPGRENPQPVAFRQDGGQGKQQKGRGSHEPRGPHSAPSETCSQRGRHIPPGPLGDLRQQT